MRLAIITTHPIQYYAPVFALLAKKFDLRVFYTMGKASVKKRDRGFNKIIQWDIDLLNGYEYTWVENTAIKPGSHSFKGIINPGLIKQVNDFKPEAIMVYGWAYNSHLKILRYFKNKIPVFFWGDSTLLNETKGVKNFLKTIFLKWVYSHVDRAFYVGVHNYAYYKKYGVPNHKLSYAPHAVDNGRFNTDRQQEAHELRETLMISEDDVLVLYAGKFEKVKNIELLLSAFEKINWPNVHLLLAGSGILESRLKFIASNSSKAGNIHFLGFKNQTYMPVIYQACNVFCLPSKSETWGLAVNEAMACAKAVLVSDKVGCSADLVSDKNGAIFRSEDINDLADKLNRLTCDKDRLISLGQQSAKIIKNWSFTHTAKAIENAILNETSGQN